MKRLFPLLALASLVIAGCAKINIEETRTEEVDLKPMTFSASVSEEQDTKATIDGLDIKWSAGDKIGIFDGTAFREFTLKEGAGTTSAVFEGQAAEAESYTAVYPYSKDLSVESDGIHGLSVPKIQTAGDCPVIMTAKCEDGGNAFAFKNALAYVKFTPQFDCHKVVFETYGKGREKYSRDLSGDIVLARDYDYNNYWGQYYIEIMSARVTANACNHIILTGDIKAGVPCYIAVAPRIMEAGFKFIFDAADDNLQYSRSSFKRPFSGFIFGHVLNFGEFSKESTAWTEKAVQLASYDVDVYQGGNSDPDYFDYRSIYDWKDVTRIVKQFNKIGSSKKVRIYFMEDVDFGGREIKPEKIDITGGVIHFYGYGHKISNYVQGTADYDDARHAGLFYVKKSSSFIVEGLSLYPNSFNASSKGDIYGGAFVSKAHCDALLNFEDCRVNGDINVECTGNDQAYAGGFVGMAECHGEESEYLSPSSMFSLEVKDCLMDGSVTAYSEDDIAYAGGFFGFIDSPEESFSYKIWRCRNRAEILAEGDDDSVSVSGLDGISAGGIIGRDHDGDGNVAADLNSCVNEGPVTAHAMDKDNALAGGMIGCHDSDGTSESMALYKPVKPSVNNCLNKGAITVKGGTGYFGKMSGLAAGMVGYCYNDDTVFRNCVDDGALSSDDVCAHISGSEGSYENACYWTKEDSLPGIHDKYDYGKFDPDRKSGSKPDLSAETLNELKFDASWTTRDGHLDLEIIR